MLKGLMSGSDWRVGRRGSVAGWCREGPGACPRDSWAGWGVDCTCRSTRKPGGRGRVCACVRLRVRDRETGRQCSGPVKSSRLPACVSLGLADPHGGVHRRDSPGFS